MVKRERVLSLDVMRGITIAAMLLVNNPGSWSHVYAPLLHAEWHGLTPTDLIYPFFIFIMGVSMYFSMSKYEDGFSSEAFRKIFKRSVMMFTVGLVLQWVSYATGGASSAIIGRLSDEKTLLRAMFPFGQFRIMGVMQGLAVAYLFGSLLAMTFRWKHLLWVGGALLAAYVVILRIGNGYALAEDNLIMIVDRAILGVAHMPTKVLPGGGRIAFEAEAILSSIPRIAQVLLGAWAGRLMVRSADHTDRMVKTFIFGTIALFAGLLLGYCDPINKLIWSSAFTLTTSGFAALALALLIWIVDIEKRSGWGRLFEVYGVNPLFLYATGWVLAAIFGMSFPCGESSLGVKSFLYGDVLQPLLGDQSGSVVYALFFVGVNWLLGCILYRKKIFIKF
jgi:predicted acyltransferase